ncbi:unnamed protein product, partial [Amoebophrya sp. A25]|eukprot:GSA25T00005400001.1
MCLFSAGELHAMMGASFFPRPEELCGCFGYDDSFRQILGTGERVFE